uniref:Rad51 dna recombinase 2 n=1 Tax=Tetraselmis sp. GSL018 TaxID=582737 RepID=A0A061RHC8_9CHLO
MSEKPLDRCDLLPETVSRLALVGIRTAQQLLLHSPLEVSETLDASVEFAQQLLLLTSLKIRPDPTTALELLNLSSVELRSGLRPLDDALGGGIPVAAVTEFVGPAGIGKTQLCMQLTANSVLGNKARTVLYIDTECKFSSQRFRDILRAQIHKSVHIVSSRDQLAVQAQDRVIVLRVQDLKDLLQRIKELEVACIDHSVGLIVVDSIANPVRASVPGDGAEAQVGARARNILSRAHANNTDEYGLEKRGS